MPFQNAPDPCSRAKGGSHHPKPPWTRVGHTWCRAKAGVNAEAGGDRQDFPGWYGNPKALLQPKRLPSAAAQRRIRRNEAHGVGGLLAAPGKSLWDFHPKLETAPSRRAQPGASQEPWLRSVSFCNHQSRASCYAAGPRKTRTHHPREGSRLIWQRWGPSHPVRGERTRKDAQLSWGGRRVKTQAGEELTSWK